MASRKNGSSKSGTGKDSRTVHPSRDAKTGKFVRQGEPRTANGTVVGREKSPDVFLDKFTSHPVVDELMKRLSK